MPITEAQEARMLSERAARNKQNPKHPYLINVKDGRLLPNVPALAGRPQKGQPGQPGFEPAKPGHRNYRIYTGDPKAALDERMRWLQTQVGSVGRPITLVNIEPFDVGTATLDELIEFAQTEYGVALSKQLGLKAVRAEVIKLATDAGRVSDSEEKLN